MQIRNVVTLFTLNFIFLPQIAFGQTLPIVFPVDGEASFRDDFLDARGGGSRQHLATDILADKHTPVVAVVDGVITYIPSPEPSWGYMITLQGNDNRQYRYIHLNNDTLGTDDGNGGVANAYAPGLKRGSDVRAGQILGWLGDSGNAENTASHLHFEIRDSNKTPINPYPSLLAAAPANSFLADVSTHVHQEVSDTVEAIIDAESRFYFTIELREGMQGEAIRELQTRLKEEGFFTNSYTTKYFGPLTKEALIKFQRANNIAPSGVFGFESRAILNNETVSGSTLRLEKELFEGAEGDTVLQIQLKLKELGFYKDETNGVFGPELREAIRRFQNENSSLTPTGHMSFKTWNELNTQYAVAPKVYEQPSPTNETAVLEASGNYTFTLSLSIGARGNEVVSLQQFLQNLGHFPSNIETTGYYGPITAKAVSSFQDASGIETVGVVGPITRAALNSA